MHRGFLRLLFLLLIPAVAGATTLVQMSLDELAAAAPVVARVRCLENDIRKEGGEIWTFTRFEVVETLKGNVPQEITVRLIGGRLGHWISKVDGIPQFRPGEELYLFLEPTPSGSLGVTSWVQGTFRIARQAGSDRETVVQDTSSVTVFDPATRRFRPGGLRNLSVEEFRRQVRATLERQAQRRTP